MLVGAYIDEKRWEKYFKAFIVTHITIQNHRILKKQVWFLVQRNKLFILQYY